MPDAVTPAFAAWNPGNENSVNNKDVGVKVTTQVSSYR
jgi:hypothetical protein